MLRPELGGKWGTVYSPLRRVLEASTSGGTQRRALPRYQSEEIKIYKISFPILDIETTTVAYTVAR